jgi:hypothetical protein
MQAAARRGRREIEREIERERERERERGERALDGEDLTTTRFW